MKLDQLLEQLTQKNAAGDSGIGTGGLLKAADQQKQANGAENQPEAAADHQQQMGIISAFLKANPLPTFSSSSANTKTSSSTNCSGGESGAQKQQQMAKQSAGLLTNGQCSSTAVVPFNQEVVSQGLLAVGGCRQCSKTFTDRLSLVHHFVDHFPNIFYSFEERAEQQQQNGKPVKTSPSPKTSAAAAMESSNGSGSSVNGSAGTMDGPPTSADLLGQLTRFFAMTGGTRLPNGMAANTANNGSSSTAMAVAQPMMPPPISMMDQQMFGANFINNLLLNKSMNNGSGQQHFQQNNRNGNTNSKGSNVPHQQRQNGQGSRSKKRQIQAQENAATAHGQQQEEQSRPLAKKASNGNGHENNNNNNKATGMPSLSELPYHMCPHCCLTFSETTAYKAHLVIHESELTNSLSSAPGGGGGMMPPFSSLGSSPFFLPSDQQLLKCPHCDMKFSTAFRLNEHMQLHSIHSCDTCQKTFMTAFDLNLHMGTHTGYTYDCKDCGKCFPCRKTLAEHNRSHRMLFSTGASTSPEPLLGSNNNDANAVLKNKPLDMPADRENNLLADLFFEQQHQIADQNGRDRRKIRMPRKGEKSRRNATLVALESTPPPSGSSVPGSATTTPPELWPSPKAEINSAELVNPADAFAGLGLPSLMGQLLMRANSALLEQQQQNGVTDNGEEEGATIVEEKTTTANA